MAIVTSAGFWADNYSFKIGRSPKRRQLKRMRQTIAARKDAALLVADIGIAVGQTASETIKQVQHTQAPGAPLPTGTVETRTLVSRATVSGDETIQEAELNSTFSIPTYAADASGNGGGSKIQGS